MQPLCVDFSQEFASSVQERFLRLLIALDGVAREKVGVADAVL